MNLILILKCQNKLNYLTWLNNNFSTIVFLYFCTTWEVNWSSFKSFQDNQKTKIVKNYNLQEFNKSRIIVNDNIQDSIVDLDLNMVLHCEIDRLVFSIYKY